jgi:hypothetical protein
MNKDILDTFAINNSALFASQAYAGARLATRVEIGRFLETNTANRSKQGAKTAEDGGRAGGAHRDERYISK